jgi:hypothetical protein
MAQLFLVPSIQRRGPGVSARGKGLLGKQYTQLLAQFCQLCKRSPWRRSAVNISPGVLYLSFCGSTKEGAARGDENPPDCSMQRSMHISWLLLPDHSGSKASQQNTGRAIQSQCTSLGSSRPYGANAGPANT